jgi:hypothetical protein
LNVNQASQLELRPMGVGDILDTALRLYRTHLASFLTISLVVYVPYIVLLLVLQSVFSGPTTIQQTPFGPREVAPIGLTLVNSLRNFFFFVVVWPLVQGALMYNISAAYLGENLSAGESYRRALARTGALLGTQFAVGLVVMLGFVLLIVPGIIFSMWYMVVAPVVLLETVSGSKAMSRSKALMSGNLGKGFMLGLVVGIVSFVASFAVTSVLRWFGLTHPVVEEVVTEGVQGVLLPFLVAPTILLYYDLRIRKEAFDLERLSSTLSGAPAPAL